MRNQTNTLNKVKFNNVVTACGNVLRASATVAGKEYCLEMDLEKTWINVIDCESRCETCAIDEEGDVVSESGECVTQDWSEQDWSDLTDAVGSK